MNREPPVYTQSDMEDCIPHTVFRIGICDVQARLFFSVQPQGCLRLTTLKGSKHLHIQDDGEHLENKRNDILGHF